MAVDPRRHNVRVIAEQITARYYQVRHPSGRDRAEPVCDAEHFRRRRRQRRQRCFLAQSTANRQSQPRPKIFLRFFEFFRRERELNPCLRELRRIARRSVPVLQFVQLHLERGLRSLDLRRFRKIEWENNRRLFFG